MVFFSVFIVLMSVALVTECKYTDVIKTQPGSNVSLPCNFSRYQNLSRASKLVWRYKGKVIFSGQFTPISSGLDNVRVTISGQNISYLEIENVATSNQGNYSCIVENIFVASYVLEIEGRMHSLIEKTVGLGTTISLKCNGHGHHTWSFNDPIMFNGDSPSGNRNHRYLRPTTINDTFSQLDIANISRENDGYLTCFIQGVAKLTYYLRVQDIQLHVTINGQNDSTIQYLFSHVKYNVSCKMSEQVLEHDQTILLRSYSLPENYLIASSNGSNTATVNDVVFDTKSLKVMFLCTGVDDFNNEYGKATKMMDVSVVPKLAFQRDGKNISDKHQVHIGEIFILKCVAFSSRPYVELRWKKGRDDNALHSETIIKPNEFQLSTYNTEIQIKLMAKERIEITCCSSGPSNFHKLEATLFIEINSEESLKLLLIVALGGFSAFTILLLLIAYVRLRSQSERRENAELLALSLWQETASSSLKGDPRKSVKSLRISRNVSKIERATDSGFTSTESAISCETVTLVSPLHCGERIDYWLGRYSSNDGDIDCICETVSEKAAMKDGYNFLNLAKSLRCLPNHTNIVSFLGNSTDEVPYYIYREYVTNNTLRYYLSRSFNSNQSSQLAGDPSKADITDKKYQRKTLSTDVASAMDFLHIQQLHHPALSARKVLLTNAMIPKLFDFWPEELSTIRATSLLKSLDPPTAWLPPETIFLDKYEKSSDVWAYGVLLWEMFSPGQIPFHSKQPKEIEDEIRDMKLLPQPKNCSRASFDIILSTWNKNPELRPSFADLKHQIQSLPESFTETDGEE